MEIVRIQQALRAAGMYDGNINGEMTPELIKAMNEFYPILLKLKSENAQMKNDIRIAKEALLKW